VGPKAHDRPGRRRAGAASGLASGPALVAIGGGLAAAGVAWTGMRLLRSTLQVRTVPERLAEWALLFVPLDLFEAGLLRFGFAAKEYALGGAIAVTLVLLAGLGILALGRRWAGPALAGLGAALWLLTMAVIMPLTGAGFFATGLVRGTGAAVGGYLAVALAYACTLATASALVEAAGGSRARRAASGRSALILAGAAAAVSAGTPLIARWSPHPSLPEAVVSAPQNVIGPDAGPPAVSQPAAAPPAAPPPQASREVPWNTSDLDALANGNLARAVDLVASAGVPAGVEVAAGAGRAPWEFLGEVHAFTGTVDRVREYTPGAPPPPWPTDRRPLGEVVLVDSADSAFMPVVCLAPGGEGGLREGDRARVRGYVVGLAGTENRTGGSTTGLVLVGELAPLPP
jgi:hypothetical protein